MRFKDIFPYVADLRYELLDTISDLTQEQWETRFGRQRLYSAEHIVYRLTEDERWWIGHVCQSLSWDDIRPVVRRDKTEAIDQLKATFALTERYIETLEQASLRFVRTVPPDIQSNRPEENRRIENGFFGE